MSVGGFSADNQFLATLREASRYNNESDHPTALPATAFPSAPSSKPATSNPEPAPPPPSEPTAGAAAASSSHPPRPKRFSSGSLRKNSGLLQQQLPQPPSPKPPPAPPIAPRRSERHEAPQSVLFERVAAGRVSSLPAFVNVSSQHSVTMMSGELSAPQHQAGGGGNNNTTYNGHHNSNGARQPLEHGFSTALAAAERRLSNASCFTARDSELTFGRETILGPKRPRPHKIWRKKYIKLLVVGDSGLGKTTLIRSLMSTPGDRLQVHDGTFTPTDQFKKDPSSLCSTISWRDEEDRVIWVYKIQDTPGYGDDLNVQNSIDMMLHYIQHQNDKWLEMEQSRDRKEDLSEVEDTRVDICLFCLPPHRMRPIDLKYMYELGLHVPIVPVVTKADTMTIREAATYRNEVASKIANPMLQGIHDKINVFKFERDTLERAGVLDHGVPTPPFLVVASNEINEDMNQAEPATFWPERRYPWGTAEAFNREHSDLLSLRALLLKEALEEINKTKRQRYEGWRRAALRQNQWGRRLRHMLMWTVVPAVLCLQVGKRGINVGDIKSSVRSNASKAKDFIDKRRGKYVAIAPPAPPPAPPAAAAPAKKKGYF